MLCQSWPAPESWPPFGIEMIPTLDLRPYAPRILAGLCGAFLFFLLLFLIFMHKSA